jgi:hypothetical protein
VVLPINRAFCDLLELEGKQEAIGKKCYDLLPSDLCRTQACPLQRISVGEQYLASDVNLEINQRCKVPFWITATPLKGLAEEIIGVVVQLKNISERKRYEEELKQANVRLERLAAVDGLTQ